jgi:hypothetical protein
VEFLSAADVRRRAPATAREDAQSEAPECELRERQERVEAEEVGAGDEEQPGTNLVYGVIKAILLLHLTHKETHLVAESSSMVRNTDQRAALSGDAGPLLGFK